MTMHGVASFASFRLTGSLVSVERVYGPSDSCGRSMPVDAAKPGSLRRLARMAGEVVAETLWPTRCALCDMPGDVLCDSCTRLLPYLDWWRACHTCGSAYGAVQCDMCNPVSLERIGRERLPFASCASATVFTNMTGRLVRVYKDQGEQRLAKRLAAIMTRAIPPSWRFDTVTFVPATEAAFRRRGFDHAELLASSVAARLGRPYAGVLARPMTRDQRSLSSQERIDNLAIGFKVREDMNCIGKFLLIDDVLTTGSTLCAATDALLGAGAVEVYCLTFARV